MSRTYKAVLRGDRLDWIGPAPPPSPAVPVHVTLLEERTEHSPNRGRAMASALEALARAGGISAIPEPAAWQRDVRRDRPLPGREG
jgi:hypothetical protein